MCSGPYDVSAHVGSACVEYRCCICLAHRGAPMRRLCGACAVGWTRLREFEWTLAATRASEPEAFVREVAATRAVVGASLHFRVDLLCVNLLLESAEGIQALVELTRRRFLRSECKNGPDCLSLWDTNGTVDLSVSRSARRAAHSEGISEPAMGSRSTIPTNLRMQKIASVTGLTALVLDGLLASLDVTGNSDLEEMPVDELAQVRSLRSIECRGCPRLFSPTTEIAVQGGQAVVSYLRAAYEDGFRNTTLELVLLGNCESGKTSLKRALLSEPATSEELRQEERTVGLDMRSTWDLRTWGTHRINHDTSIADFCSLHQTSVREFQKRNANISCDGSTTLLEGTEVASLSGLLFRVKDFGGLTVYELTNKMFMVQRAIYVLVWRVQKGHAATADARDSQNEQMVGEWMEKLSSRVPGASVVLVATHVDCCSADEVQRQVKHIKGVVQSSMASLHQENQTSDYHVAPLIVWNEGESLRVNCLKGEGVKELEKALKDMAHQSRCWREVLPASLVRLQRAISRRVAKGAPWVTWSEYAAMAQRCHMTDSFCVIATKYLHHNALIQYFGSHDTYEKKTPRDNTVFINMSWVVDGLKIIRHDTTALLTFLGGIADVSTRQRWEDRVKLLFCYGILHRELLPFLVPLGVGRTLSSSFWEKQTDPIFAREAGLFTQDVAAVGEVAAKIMQQEEIIACKAEDELLGMTHQISNLDARKEKQIKGLVAKYHQSVRNACTASDNGYQRVLILLQGCGIIHQVSDHKYFIPCLQSHDRIDSRSFSSADSSQTRAFYFRYLPGDFFIRLVQACLETWHCDHWEMSKGMAVFYVQGSKVQIFQFKHQSVLRGDRARLAVELKCLASTDQQLDDTEIMVSKLKEFYPGLRILEATSGHSPLQRGKSPLSRTTHSTSSQSPIPDMEAHPAEPIIQVGMIEAVPALNATMTISEVNWDRAISEALSAGKVTHSDVARSEIDGKYNLMSARLLGIAIWPAGSGSPDMHFRDVERAKGVVYFRVSSDSLRQDPDTLAFLTSHLRQWGISINNEFVSVRNTIRDIILDIDRDNVLTVRSEIDNVDMSRLRVVLVIMDQSIATDERALSIFRKTVDARLDIIPIITPAYDFPPKMSNGRTTDVPDFER